MAALRPVEAFLPHEIERGDANHGAKLGALRARQTITAVVVDKEVLTDKGGGEVNAQPAGEVIVAGAASP